MSTQRHVYEMDVAEWGTVALGAALAVGLLLLALAGVVV
jgi:hypothetical protein